ncbi:hypothetical protein GOODEAATRI_009723, partial [Goodea atripinnis]
TGDYLDVTQADPTDCFPKLTRFQTVEEPELIRRLAATDLLDHFCWLPPGDSCLTPIPQNLSTLHCSQATQPRHCSTRDHCPLCVLGALVLTARCSSLWSARVTLLLAEFTPGLPLLRTRATLYS